MGGLKCCDILWPCTQQHQPVGQEQDLHRFVLSCWSGEFCGESEDTCASCGECFATARKQKVAALL